MRINRHILLKLRVLVSFTSLKTWEQYVKKWARVEAARADWAANSMLGDLTNPFVGAEGAALSFGGGSFSAALDNTTLKNTLFVYTQSYRESSIAPVVLGPVLKSRWDCSDGTKDLLIYRIQLNSADRSSRVPPTWEPRKKAAWNFFSQVLVKQIAVIIDYNSNRF